MVPHSIFLYIVATPKSHVLSKTRSLTYSCTKMRPTGFGCTEVEEPEYYTSHFWCVESRTRDPLLILKFRVRVIFAEKVNSVILC